MLFFIMNVACYCCATYGRNCPFLQYQILFPCQKNAFKLIQFCNELSVSDISLICIFILFLALASFLAILLSCYLGIYLAILLLFLSMFLCYEVSMLISSFRAILLTHQFSTYLFFYFHMLLSCHLFNYLSI